jgi:hypothetical protein
MLQTSDEKIPSAGRLEGSFADRSGWTQLPMAGYLWTLRIYLGDPESGPLIYAFSEDPVTFPEGAPKPEYFETRTHYHLSPTFRIALGPQPRHFKIDTKWYGPGDYIFLDSKRFYNDPMGVDGGETLIIFADRRGVIPFNRESKGLSAEQIIAREDANLGKFGPGLPSILMSSEGADTGVAVTNCDQIKAGRAPGSIFDRSDWSELSDGSRVAAGFLGSKPDGPLVIFSANTPGAAESPQGTAKSDLFRLVVKGSCTLGDRRYDAGEFIAIEAGRIVQNVIHGPQGSTQILFAADRRAWSPVDDQGNTVRSVRQEQIAHLLDKLRSRIAASRE